MGVPAGRGRIDVASDSNDDGALAQNDATLDLPAINQMDDVVAGDPRRRRGPRLGSDACTTPSPPVAGRYLSLDAT
ncbi:hypothetical protein [Mycolicibacterium iranicum]|uniref:Uncharacterized protein n=1 Tax=Mycolicibacterium iranicum TaxID=912594 RepID=A0A178M162_MYCIR|nr:hypothetical protein [Mycolicibacterium iranicum]OAN40290.1 hypothetical protein A4X20_14285 [Mycolicibacterium iranicum]